MCVIVSLSPVCLCVTSNRDWIVDRQTEFGLSETYAAYLAKTIRIENTRIC